MNNQILQLKIKQRLNKLSSNDYDNIESWQIIEAFNKAQLQWVRRQLHAGNARKEGDEGSKRRIDDLQILLVDQVLTGTQNAKYFESTSLPSDYLEFKRVSTLAKSECCPADSMTVYLAEEANVDSLLNDNFRNPSFEWGETFCTLFNDTIRIYTDNKFTVINPTLTYYRKPVYIQITGTIDPYTGLTSTTDVSCEFRDDITELIIDECVGILAGDIESMNQLQIAKQSVENNN
jgi:hypothetical protein